MYLAPAVPQFLVDCEGWRLHYGGLQLPQLMLDVPGYVTTGLSRGSRISARGGRQVFDDLIWDGDERFLTYANTGLRFFKMFIVILCLNDVEQPLPFCA